MCVPKFGCHVRRYFGLRYLQRVNLFWKVDIETQTYKGVGRTQTKTIKTTQPPSTETKIKKSMHDSCWSTSDDMLEMCITKNKHEHNTHINLCIYVVRGWASNAETNQSTPHPQSHIYSKFVIIKTVWWRIPFLSNVDNLKPRALNIIPRNQNSFIMYILTKNLHKF